MQHGFFRSPGFSKLVQVRFSLAILLCPFTEGYSQAPDSVARFSLDFEVRPRLEFKDGYSLNSSGNFSAEAFATQRNRLTAGFMSTHLSVVASLQEIHVWGRGGVVSEVGSVSAFEFYIAPKLKNFSARIGRQALLLDNGRMFSDAPWAQQSRAHEGVRLFYSRKNFTTDLTWAFTRTYSGSFDPAYSPVGSHFYKYLAVHHLKAMLSDQVEVITVNVVDSFENSQKSEYARATSGGRIAYFGNSIYLTLSAFYQYGRDSALRSIRAFYLQPEFRKMIGNMTVRLGAELLSGEDLSGTSVYSRSFVPLYGVAWKFMGNMNFFTRFPADVNSSGLINPYLFLLYRVDSKLGLRADTHLFYSHFPLLDSDMNQSERFLGSEFDFSFNYRLSGRLDIHYGFSVLFPTQSMVVPGKIEAAGRIPVWSYLMVSFKPLMLRGR